MHKLYDFMEARERLSTITVKTKLLHSDVFSDECGNDVYIKPENLQITGSFKVRGAYNKIAKLTEEEKARGVIAASAGNHAQGVALAAKLVHSSLVYLFTFFIFCAAFLLCGCLSRAAYV